MTQPHHSTTPRHLGAGGFVLCAVLLVGGAPLGVSDSATGATKPPHDVVAVSEEIGGVGSGKFRAYGAASTHKDRKITIQLRVGGRKWTAWKVVRTGAEDGSFSERIYGGKRGTRACYRVVVPRTKLYRPTKVRLGCIVTK